MFLTTVDDADVEEVDDEEEMKAETRKRSERWADHEFDEKKTDKDPTGTRKGGRG